MSWRTVDFTVTVSSVATTDAWTLVYTLDGTTETTTGTGAGTFSVTTTNTVTSTSDVLALVSITNNTSPDNCNSSLTESVTIAVDPTTIAGVITEATDTICKGGSTTISQTTAGTGVIVGWEYMAASGSNWTGISNTNTTLKCNQLQETTSYRAVYQSGLCDYSTFKCCNYHCVRITSRYIIYHSRKRYNLCRNNNNN